MGFKHIALVLSLFVLLSGCAEQRVVDDIALIQAVSYDRKGDKLRGSVMIPFYQNEETTKSDIITSEAETARGLRIKINEKSPKPLLFGQLRVVLYGDSLAENGLIENLDILFRDPSVGNRLFLTVTEGKASALLQKDISSSEHAAIYIANMIEQNIKSENLPKTNLHQFMYSYYSDGRDPILPYLKNEKGKEHIKIKGIALFQGDRMVGHLTKKEMFFFKLLSREGYQNGSIEVELDKDDEEKKEKDIAVIENVKSDARYHVMESGGKIKMDVKSDMVAIVKEFTGESQLDDSQVVKEIEKMLEKKIEKESLALLKKFQEMEIDPLGLGERYRTTQREWVPKKWRDRYPEVEFDIKAEVKIEESGVVE